MSSALFRRALFPRAATGNLFLSPISSSSSVPNSPSPPNQPETAVTTAVSVLINHRSKSRWSTLLSLFPDGFTPPQISQILLQIRNNPRLAERFFHFATIHSLSTPPNLHCYATIIHILARARLKSHAQSIMKEAVRVRVSELDEPKLLFRELVETYRVCNSAPFVFDLLIRSLLELNKLDPCVEIFRTLQSSGIFPHVITCNALVSKGLRLRGCSLGYDLYREVFGFKDNDDKFVKRGAKRRASPNVHTFNELMLAFHRNGSIDMVEEMWIEMGKFRCIPKVCSYTILMAAYCEKGEMEKAENVWDELRAKGLNPDIVAYNTLIGRYCKMGDIVKGEELYREMELRGLKGSCVTYQHLINGYCLARDADNAMLLYRDMHRKGFIPDSSTIDSMIRVLCDKKSVSEALDFFGIVMENAGFVARQSSYEYLITGLCCEGKMEEALKLQAQMVGKGFRPNSRIYVAFIDGYTKQGKLDLAESLGKEMMATQH